MFDDWIIRNPFLLFSLQILNQKDPNWWQAQLMEPPGPMGLIPSQELEERRKAFVPPEADYVHKIGICGTRVSGIVWEQLLKGVLAKFINSVLR